MANYKVKDSDLHIIPTKTKFTEEGLRKKMLKHKFELKNGIWTLKSGKRKFNQTQLQLIGMLYGYGLLTKEEVT